MSQFAELFVVVETVPPVTVSNPENPVRFNPAKVGEEIAAISCDRERVTPVPMIAPVPPLTET